MFIVFLTNSMYDNLNRIKLNGKPYIVVGKSSPKKGYLTYFLVEVEKYLCQIDPYGVLAYTVRRESRMADNILFGFALAFGFAGMIGAIIGIINFTLI